MNILNRWGIALAGILLQMVLGAVYAWSVFRAPLAKQFHWSISQVTLTFTIAIMVVGFAAFFGGLWLKRSGPRVVSPSPAQHSTVSASSWRASLRSVSGGFISPTASSAESV